MQRGKTSYFQGKNAWKAAGLADFHKQKEAEISAREKNYSAGSDKIGSIKERKMKKDQTDWV